MCYSTENFVIDGLIDVSPNNIEIASTSLFDVFEILFLLEVQTNMNHNLIPKNQELVRDFKVPFRGKS